jgi:hypothetical protein
VRIVSPHPFLRGDVHGNGLGDVDQYDAG